GLLSMIEQATEMGFIDPQRLAITGLSQGGHGTIALASAHPEMFVAAAPVCGYVERRFDDNKLRREATTATPEDPAVVTVAEKLAAMPVWLFHGDSDTVVSVTESRSLHKALTKLDATVKYTEVPDTGHNSWDAAYADADLAAWFREHTR
ncbi:MAG: prolyl oligopeptidase family serine peptidase, partial [Phycisphaerales bacterium]